MSSLQEQAAIQAIADTIAVNHVFIAALGLLVYDTLLTLPHEIEYVWCKKFKLGTVLYLLARYSMLFISLASPLVQYLNGSLQTCNAFVRFMAVFLFLALVGNQGLLLARTYAISQRKRLTLAILGLLGFCAIMPVLPLAILNGCNTTNSNQSIITLFRDINTIAVILFDTVVCIVSCSNILGIWRFHKRSAWRSTSFVDLLAQQNLMRILFVTTITLSNAILVTTLRPTIQGVLSAMQNSLSTIVICRFHLDLQKRNAHPNASTSWGRFTPSNIGSFHAATNRVHDAVVAEFGDSIRHSDNESVGTERRREDIVLDLGISAARTEGDITLEKFQSRPYHRDAGTTAV